MKKPKMMKDKPGKAVKGRVSKGDGTKPKMGLKGALFGGKRPGGRDSAGKREKRLEGKPL